MRKEVSRYRTLIEWTLSVVALTTIVLVMYTVDSPVRQYANAFSAETREHAFDMRVPAPVVSAGRSAWRICMDHQPLAAFAGVAAVLVLFMRRTR